MEKANTGFTVVSGTASIKLLSCGVVRRSRFLFREVFHGRILVHVMVLVEMILKLIVATEGCLDALHRADEAEDLILTHEPRTHDRTELTEIKRDFSG